jgi:1-acyl-sn-glycerol-3-phosphate acyltransferase
MLQYTSGSTGDTKGVILTHRHLLANITAMGAAAQAGPSDVFVSWLPLYQDMGLIGAWLASLYLGFPLVVMSPLAFLARPARWLRAISEHHGTLSCAPNFAYELCVRRISSQNLQGVDLSSWRLVIALPRLRARWAVIRAAERLLRLLLEIPLTVTGQPPEAQPFVAVANHASFADGLILILCFPEPVWFTAAARFASNWPFLRRIGCQFVHRAEPAQAATETRRLAGMLHSGRSLVIWPEGALHPAPGLRPFHLGTFDAAVSAAAPVVPLGIRGSRRALRPGTRFPRRYAIHVANGEPINPAGHGWPAILALRNQARTAVLALSAEPRPELTRCRSTLVCRLAQAAHCLLTSDRRADRRETRGGKGSASCGSPSRGARRLLRYSAPLAFTLPVTSNFTWMQAQGAVALDPAEGSPRSCRYSGRVPSGRRAR